MLIIPVIDLMGGQVVRGVAGRRSEYRPIRSQLAVDANPATVAQALVDGFDFRTTYVADLDAIMGRGEPDIPSWKTIARSGMQLWLDAGVQSAEAARRLIETTAAAGIKVVPIVGLESLASRDELDRFRDLASAHPLIFSLDMKEGAPLVKCDAWDASSPLEIASLAIAVGIQDVIVLDLADVGAGGGTRTIQLCRQLRSTVSGRLVAGGGVRGVKDLLTLRDAGCDARRWSHRPCTMDD